MLVKEIQWKPIPEANPNVTSVQKLGSTKMVHHIAPPTSHVTHSPEGPVSSQQHIHHHYYHYPDGRTEKVTTPSNVPPKEPPIMIPNPEKNIQLAPGFQKVITPNPDSFNPDEAQENHSLKNLGERPLLHTQNPKKRSSATPSGISIRKQAKPQKQTKQSNPDKKYKFKKTLRTEEIDKAIPCPIEDPRNPYHQEYLKLKAMSDGHLKEASMLSQAPSQATDMSGFQDTNNTNPGISRPASRAMTTSIHNVTPMKLHPQQVQSPTFQSKTMNALPKEVNIYQNAPLSSKAMNNGEVYAEVTPANTPSEHEPENEENLPPVEGYIQNYQSYHNDQNYQVPLYKKPQVVTQVVDNFDYCDDCDVAFTKKPSLEPAFGKGYNGGRDPQIEGRQIQWGARGSVPVNHYVNREGFA